MSKSPAQRAKEWREKRLIEIEAMPKKLCACGCGEWMCPINVQGKPVDYIKGHKQRGMKRNKPSWNRLGERPLTNYERQRRHREKKFAEVEQLPKVPCACGCGTMISPIGRGLQLVKFAHGHNNVRGVNIEVKPQSTGAENLIISFAPYGIGFTKKYKRLIRERDQYTCQRCGMKWSKGHRPLHIHHLDHNPTNNDPSNLVTACHQCNDWAKYYRDETFINPEVWTCTHDAPLES